MSLRHRAVLLGLVGIGLPCAAFIASPRVTALVTGTVIMGTFLLFAYATPALNSATRLTAQGARA
ncbi:hypothetical protein [Streptomyces venetus]|uniref:hypothetical protein n=1 Tax=Streptomyces venetus TaxID=1701086 RepID=UPI003C2B10A8